MPRRISIRGSAIANQGASTLANGDSLTMLKFPGDEVVTVELVHRPGEGPVVIGSGFSHLVVQVGRASGTRGSTNARPRPLPLKCTLSIAPNAPTICKLCNSAIAHLPNSAQDAVRSLTDARRAPSVIDSNFAHTIGGTTQNGPATVPNPQSVPAITLSAPTFSA